MLYEEVQAMKEKEPTLVIPAKGACRYCGQIAEIEVLLNWGPAEMETVATELCDCTDSQLYTKKMRSRESAKNRIEQLFGEADIADSMHQELVPFLLMTVDAVMDGKVASCTCNIGNGIKAIIKQQSNGMIKVQRVIKSDTSYSI